MKLSDLIEKAKAMLASRGNIEAAVCVVNEDSSSSIVPIVEIYCELDEDEKPARAVFADQDHLDFVLENLDQPVEEER